MKNYRINAVITINETSYLKIIGIIIPFLNFLSGVSFDLHAPSIPHLAIYFDTTTIAVKNTISISLFGFSLGCLLFGVLLDLLGRRITIILCLLIYTIASFSAIWCININQLLFVRFVQGFSVACISIGCRTIAIDKFTGHQFKVILLYTSLAFGIGPIIAPFLGGYLEYHFGWQANFIAYGCISFTLMLLVFLFVEESKLVKASYKIKHILNHHWEILYSKEFLFSSIVIGFSQIQLLIYTTIGAVLVENVLHKSAITYGNSALVISSGYLIGTIINRLSIKRFSTHALIRFGFIILAIGNVMQFLLSIYAMNLATIIIPIWLISFSNGFIFINLFSSSLKALANKNKGIVTSLITSATMVIGSIGIFVISHVVINNLLSLALIFLSTLIIQVIIYFGVLRKILNEAQ